MWPRDCLRPDVLYGSAQETGNALQQGGPRSIDCLGAIVGGFKPRRHFRAERRGQWWGTPFIGAPAAAGHGEAHIGGALNTLFYRQISDTDNTQTFEPKLRRTVA